MSTEYIDVEERFKVAGALVGSVCLKLDDLKYLDILPPNQIQDVKRTLEAILRKGKLAHEKQLRREKLMEGAE